MNGCIGVFLSVPSDLRGRPALDVRRGGGSHVHSFFGHELMDEYVQKQCTFVTLDRFMSEGWRAIIPLNDNIVFFYQRSAGDLSFLLPSEIPFW